MNQACRYVPDDRRFVDMFPHTDGILDMFPHTVDIHTAVSGHVETVVLLTKAYEGGINYGFIHCQDESKDWEKYQMSRMQEIKGYFK